MLSHYLYADEICEEHPFTHPDETKRDFKLMKEALNRLLCNLHTLTSKNRKDSGRKKIVAKSSFYTTYTPTSEDANAPTQVTSFDLPKQEGNEGHSFYQMDMDGKSENLRCVIKDMDKFLGCSRLYIVGFFSAKFPTSPVMAQIFGLDDKFVVAVPTFDFILCYLTLKTTSGEFYNLVFLDNPNHVSSWKSVPLHQRAVQLSPQFYRWTRIHNCLMLHSIRALMVQPCLVDSLIFLRTKYTFNSLANADVAWRAVRVYTQDEVFFSSAIPHSADARPFTFASFLGSNAFPFYQALVAKIGKMTGLPVRIVDMDALTAGITPRPADLRSISDHKIDFAFTCGLAYVKSTPNLVPLVAPVRLEERYKGQPVYFSDVIVHSQSKFQKVQDLAGATFAINERVSMSGYQMPVHYFTQLCGSFDGFFGKILETGAHANSMNQVQGGAADSASIDSVVFEMEMSQKPERRKEFRVLASIGPYTMPPVVASAWVPSRTRSLVANALASLHQEDQELLAKNGFLRFSPVADSHYDDIRALLKLSHS